MLQGIFTNHWPWLRSGSGDHSMAAPGDAAGAPARDHLERETVVALIRGIVQIIAVWLDLLLLLRGPAWTQLYCFSRPLMWRRRDPPRSGQGMPGRFGSRSTRLRQESARCRAHDLGRVIDTTMTSLVPIAALLISNAMNTNSLTLNRSARR